MERPTVSAEHVALRTGRDPRTPKDAFYDGTAMVCALASGDCVMIVGTVRRVDGKLELTGSKAQPLVISAP